METNKESRFIIIKDKFSCIFDHLIHIIIFAALCYILWIPIKYYRHLLSWHVILGTIAVLFLMSEAILLFSKNPWYTSSFVKEYQRWIHGILLLIATILFLLSTYFEYHHKSARKGHQHKHFDSVHGVTALLTTILAVFSCILGLLTAKSETFRKYLFETRPVILKLIHNALGLLVYTLGIISLCCAYYSNWLQGIISPLGRIFLVFITLFIAVWTLKHAVKSFILLVRGEFTV